MGNFNLKKIKSAEFLIQKEDEQLYKISIDDSVEDLLQLMVDVTLSELGNNILPPYTPSEKYNSKDKLQICLENTYCKNIFNIYSQSDIPVDNTQISSNVDKIYYYFFRITDENDNVLLAIKKASYFKAVTTHHYSIIGLVNDTLTSFSENLFKLDNSFDILIYNNTVYINKYLVFEELAQLADVVREASIDNIEKIEQDTSIIHFTDETKEYIKTHIMAARLIASIKSSGLLNNLSLDAVKEACKKQGISIRTLNEQISFDSENTMNFLKLIDRRLFDINLTGTDELYEAQSRQIRGK